eukprot:Awhi_evm1s3348
MDVAGKDSEEGLDEDGKDCPGDLAIVVAAEDEGKELDVDPELEVEEEPDINEAGAKVVETETGACDVVEEVEIREALAVGALAEVDIGVVATMAGDTTVIEDAEGVDDDNEDDDNDIDVDIDDDIDVVVVVDDDDNDNDNDDTEDDVEKGAEATGMSNSIWVVVTLLLPSLLLPFL